MDYPVHFRKIKCSMRNKNTLGYFFSLFLVASVPSMILGHREIAVTLCLLSEKVRSLSEALTVPQGFISIDPVELSGKLGEE